jgi:glycosyltransferase involved in cell wall biosynthesis
MVEQKKILSSKKKVILCFIKYYLPGYRSGGPVRSIVNFVEKFGDVYDIRIVCSSHDAIDDKPYENIIIEEWNQVGKAKVFYVSNKIIKFKKIFDLLSDMKYDIIYLNSFFTFTFSIFPLMVQYFKFINLKSCVIAPRGEFTINAIKIKKLKKLIYIFFVKIIGLYKHVCWQASSELESEDIRRVIGVTARNIQVAPDLNFLKWSINDTLPYQRKDVLKIVFLSRISPMKNLDFLINILAGVSYPLELSILGPKEDLHYWDVCKKLIDKLPNYIKVNIGGEISPEKVQETFSKYDLFVFPTRGENFGHVIPEALSAGTPILLSDETPWQKDASLGLQIIPLQKQKWIKAVEEWINLSDAEILKRRQAAKNYSNKITLENEKSILRNKLLFDYKSTCLN